MNLPMKQLTEMFARTADGVLVLDLDQKVVFWNQAAERLLGFQADEVLGRGVPRSAGRGNARWKAIVHGILCHCVSDRPGPGCAEF